MKTKIAKLFCGLLMISSFSVHSATVAPVTTAGSLTACQNSTISVPLTVTGFTAICGVSLRLDYNPAEMTFTGSSNLNTSFPGMYINDIAVSSTLHKIIFVWTDIIPVTLADSSKLADLNFILINGPAVLSFNNTSNGGQDCEYADSIGDPLPDAPSGSYFYDATILMYPTPPTPVIAINALILSSDASTGNQWYDQNGLITGATGQNYAPLTEGDYYDIVTLNGCSSDTSNLIDVIFVGLPETENNIYLKAYPNPATNYLIIEYEGNGKDVRYMICNATWQNVVYKSTILQKTTLNTSDFKPGTYLIKLETGKGYVVKKFVKE